MNKLKDLNFLFYMNINLFFKDNNDVDGTTKLYIHVTDLDFCRGKQWRGWIQQSLLFPLALTQIWCCLWPINFMRLVCSNTPKAILMINCTVFYINDWLYIAYTYTVIYLYIYVWVFISNIIMKHLCININIKYKYSNIINSWPCILKLDINCNVWHINTL